jgi:hypothetical protein
MRHRERTLQLTPAKGNEYNAWIDHWNGPFLRQQDPLSLTSYITDDLGRGKVNPLHSYQIRSFRKPVSISAELWPGKYEGEVSIANAHMTVGTAVESTLQDMNAWATKGAARARTLYPVIDEAVILGELTEAQQMLPSVDKYIQDIRDDYKFRDSVAKKRARRRFLVKLSEITRITGNTGLWWLFGVLPTAAAFKDAIMVVHRLEGAVSKALALDGVKQHRHVMLLDRQWTTESHDVSGLCWPEHVAQSWIISNGGQTRTEYSERIWFETDITYNLPKDEGHRSSKALRERLTGSQFDGRVLYELAPYSWLVDWFTSAGAVVSNAMDHTLYRLERPCIMHESIRTHHVYGRLEYFSRFGGGRKIARPYGKVVTTVKRRAPYIWGSVGLTFPELNGFQQAVLAFLVAGRAP